MTIKFKRIKEIYNGPRIKNNLIDHEKYSGVYFNPDMKAYLGKKIRIVSSKHNPYGKGKIYKIDIDMGYWNWSEDMLIK